MSVAGLRVLVLESNKTREGGGERCVCSCAVICRNNRGMSSVFDDVCSVLPQPIARHSCRRLPEGGFAALLAERYLLGNQSNCCGSFFVPAVYYCWRHFDFHMLVRVFSRDGVMKPAIRLCIPCGYICRSCGTYLLSTVLVSLVEAPDRLLSQLFLLACILYITCSHIRSRCFSL